MVGTKLDKESMALETDKRDGTSSVISFSTQNRLVCIEYPAVVKSVSNMLATLGGEEGVSKINADPSKRLEMYFRPKDPYCHPICANRFPSTNMLLRVKKKIRKRRPGMTTETTDTQQENDEEEIKFEMEVVGIIESTFKFQGMSDFQYLAMHVSPDGEQMSLYDKTLLWKLEQEDFFKKDVPLFIPPPIFSRLDTPVDYYYRPEIQHREGYNTPHVLSANLIGLSRARRPHNAVFVNFEDADVPLKPLEAALLNWKKCSTRLDKKSEAELRKLFENRPVWSKGAVKSNINMHPDKLKLLLPCVAYYMLTGPWRSLWVRIGYDPRKDPRAKQYQMLDFRIRCGNKYGYTPNDLPVKTKRSTFNYSLPITITKNAPQVVNVQDLTQGMSIHTPSKKQGSFKHREPAYIFREGILPPYRQMFYQLCDLEVESLQKIIHRNDGSESSCTERDGWCPPKTNDDLRDAMSYIIKQAIRAKRPALFSKESKETTDKERSNYEYGEEEEEEEEEDEFQASDGSENEMETEILDYV